MFEGFAQVWTPVMLRSAVKDKPVGVTIAGVPLVFFRGTGGKLGALYGHCPHRGASLALGSVHDGCVQCPFHGWQYQPDGAVHHVPLNPDAKRERLFATAFPVKEAGELIWMFTAPGKEAPVELNPPESLVDPTLTRNYIERIWKCHWTRAMENMLDSPHLPFVHRTTIGRSLNRRMKYDSKMDVNWEVTPWGGRQTSTLDGEGGLAHLDYHRPNMMALHIPIPNKVMRLHALVIPVDAHTTRLIVVGARDYLKARLFNPLFSGTNAIIAGQDQPVVESSHPEVIPPPSHEYAMPTDRATLQFRRYYFETLAPSKVDDPHVSKKAEAA